MLEVQVLEQQLFLDRINIRRWCNLRKISHFAGHIRTDSKDQLSQSVFFTNINFQIEILGVEQISCYCS